MRIDVQINSWVPKKEKKDRIFIDALDVIDSLQTPLYKTNHEIERKILTFYEILQYKD